MFLVIGALKEEVQEIKTLCNGSVTISLDDHILVTGTIGKNDVLVSQVGVGKSYSAMMTQYLIDHYHPEGIIFTGLAGSLNPDYEIGDLVIGESAIQHDLDATVLRIKRGSIPYSNYRYFTPPSDWLELALKFKPEKSRVHRGRVLTGDQFIGHGGAPAYFKEELNGDCVEMEGASVGLVAAVNDIPCILARTISDKTDGSTFVDFTNFLPIASKQSAAFIKYFLELI